MEMEININKIERKCNERKSREFFITKSFFFRTLFNVNFPTLYIVFNFGICGREVIIVWVGEFFSY